MLNPDAIQNKEFEQSVLGGYRRDEVDAFLDELEADYRKLYSENAELVEKVKNCVAKIEVYKKDEEFLKTAIINVQKLNETTMREIELKEKEVEVSSKEKAAAIIAEAEEKAGDIISKAEAESADAIRAAQEKCRSEIDAEQKAADEAISAIRIEVEIEQKKLDALRAQVAEFKNTIIELYKAHLTSISKLPEFRPVETPVVKEEPKQETPAAPAKEEAPVVEEPVEEKKTAASEEETDENTVEFKLKEKEAKAEETDDSKYAAKQMRFENLKFGVDYDIDKDE